MRNSHTFIGSPNSLLFLSGLWTLYRPPRLSKSGGHRVRVGAWAHELTHLFVLNSKLFDDLTKHLWAQRRGTGNLMGLLREDTGERGCFAPHL